MTYIFVRQFWYIIFDYYLQCLHFFWKMHFFHPNNRRYVKNRRIFGRNKVHLTKNGNFNFNSVGERVVIWPQLFLSSDLTFTFFVSNHLTSPKIVTSLATFLEVNFLYTWTFYLIKYINCHENMGVNDWQPKKVSII